MSIRSAPESGFQPRLKLFDGQGASESLEPFLTREQRTSIDHDPRLLWTMRQLYQSWFLPGLLVPRKRAQATMDRYDASLRYWEDVTGDPPLALISDEVCIDFVGLLPEWGYARKGIVRGAKIRIGRLDHYPSYWPLSSVTCKAHADRIATLLRRAGPRTDPREQTARILAEVPFIPTVTAEFVRKSPFTLEQARQITVAAKLMGKPDLPPWITHELWWQTRLALFYFTGLRGGTVTALCWGHVEDRAGQSWLSVPGSIVKTGKGIAMPLHPQLALLLATVRSLRGDAPPDELILPAGCGYRHFLTLHEELQSRAKIAEDDRQSPHAWRRTHGVQMELLGAGDGREVARVALDHADGRTTHVSYTGDIVVNQLRLRLPSLF